MVQGENCGGGNIDDISSDTSSQSYTFDEDDQDL